MDPLKFPPRNIPLIGESHVTHPTWLISVPITCLCDAKQPLNVLFGNNTGPSVCPACLNVYGLVALQGGPNVPFGVAVALIGKASKNVSDDDVAKNLDAIEGSVN